MLSLYLHFGRVLRVQEERVEGEIVQEESVQEFWIGDEEEEQEQDPEQDPLYQWYDVQDQEQYVRMIHVEKTKEIEVVLDSGADISLAPLWMKKYGKRVPERARVVLRDAQGSRIKVSEQRIIQVEFEDVSGSKVKVEEIFLISSVVHPLLAVGKLLKKGWEFRNGAATGTFLVEGTTHIPVSYNNNSLTAKAFVRTVNKESTNRPIPMYLCNNLNDIVAEGRVGWTSWRDPFQVHYSHYSLGTSEHVNVNLMYPPGKYIYRAVLIKDHHVWYLLHHSVMFEDLEEPQGPVLEGNRDYQVLTLVSTKEFPLNLIGTPKEQQHRCMFEEYTEDVWSISDDGTEVIRYHHSPRKALFNPLDTKDIPVDPANLKPNRKTYGEEPINRDFFENDQQWIDDENEEFGEAFDGLGWTGQSRFELIYPVEVKGKKTEQEQQLDSIPEEEAEQEEQQEPQAPEHRHELAGELSFVWNGHEYNQQNTLKTLKALCTEFGISRFGSKQEILRRLSRTVIEAERHHELSTAQKKYQEYALAEPLKDQKRPKPEEVAIHNLTHLPYASWCPVCVACKGKESPHFRENPEKERSSRPTFCMDFCFTGTSHDEAPAAVSLVCIDSWSRNSVCIPTAAKEKDLIEHLAEGVTYMSTQLQYGSINLKADNETTMTRLKSVIQKQRSSLGLGTVLQDAVSGQKETNGMAERAIQTIRRQALTLLKGTEENAGILIAHTHPIFSWAFRHASWILNRYHRHSGTGMTPYEWISGRPFQGQLAEFGESLMVLVNRTGTKAGKKGDPISMRGVFLGKSDNDLYITWHMDGIKTSRSAKRCPDHFDPKAISSVGIHTWEVRHTTLATRAIPRKSLPAPSVEPPPLEDSEVSKEQHQQQQLQDIPRTTSTGPLVIQGGDHGARPGVVPGRTHLSAKAKQQQALHKRKAEEDLEELEAAQLSDEAGSDPSSSSQAMSQEQQQTGPMSEASEELLPDSAMASELLSARGPPTLRKPEFEEVGTGSKIPKVDSPTKRYPPFSVGMVYEHNDEELPEPDLEPGEIWEDSEYGSDQEQDLFGDEDSGPPNLSEEEIRDLDRKAMVTEIDRLIAMQAVQRTALSEIEKEEKTEGEREEGENSGTKWLTTKFVFDWRFRERKWIRRARLVAREFKSQEHRTDTFSPATSASLVRLIPILGLQQEHSLYSIDVKDAFLQVPQRNRTACEFPKEYVELFGDEDPQCRNDGFLLLRVLPGQRDAALLWSDHFANTLQEQEFSRSVACPTLFRDTRNSILVVHVDDIQAAGKSKHLEPVLNKIGETYELKVEGPFLTDQERIVGESHQNIRFLKRKFTFHNHELHITSDPKYLTKLKEELKLKTKASKPTPCTQESQQVDNTNNLDQEQSASFRKCVGILLYVGQDRPDLQFAVRGLASKMSGPTHHSWKQLVHLVQYMSKTEGYHLVYRKTPRGISNLHQSIRNGSFDFSTVAEKQEHLLEVFSDSDWAGNKSSRKSTSSGTMFLDGQVIYTFSRNQKSVALSSGEAEYYAGASAASDSILLKEAIQFLTGRRCQVNLYLDSSAARGIITRQGVGRVKHLQIRTLFLQELHKQGTLSVHPVGTKENTADIGTKPLSGKRIKLLLHWLGFQDENNEPVGSEELQEHRSQEQAKASVRMIKSKGNFAFAALLFSAISGISEGLFTGKVSGTVLQPDVGTVFWQDRMCSDMSACEQDRMCTDTSACALDLGTVCEACFQEPFVHPQMLSVFKDLGQVVQELCSSHSLEGTEAGEASEGTAAMSAVVAKELKDLMEKQGLNIRMLAEQISELKGTMAQMTAEVVNLKTEVQELQVKWNTFIEEEQSARNEYAKYFEEQEKLKQELRADRDRLLEKEHRMAGHLGPTRSEIDEFNEYSDRAYFDAMTREQEAQEAMEENENEFYTQSFEYISEEEAGPQWQEEEEGEQDKEPEKKHEETQEEYDAKRKELLAKARADIAAKAAKSAEQERGLKTPIDKSHEWKFYTDNQGNVWKQNYKTGEKIWWNYDYKYKHQKGKGKAAYEKAGKGHRPREPFNPRDEEDAKYWERMGEMEEEKRRKREEKKATEEKKRKAAAAEEEKKRKAAAAAAEERKKMEEAEADKRKEQEARKEKKRIEELEKELAELRGETRSEAGSTRGEEGKTEKQEQASSSDEDPELKGKGPPSQAKFMRGTPKFDEDTDRNFYAVFPFDGNDYQWKWNSITHYWYYFDLEQRRWYKQEGKDAKGKQVCLTQESRWNQMKGKMKGKGKAKNKEEEEENLAKHSPDYDALEQKRGEAGKEEAEGGGSSSTDFQ